jgi:hypothetical protein
MTDNDERMRLGLLGGAKKRKVSERSLENLRQRHVKQIIDHEEGNATASCQF